MNKEDIGIILGFLALLGLVCWYGFSFTSSMDKACQQVYGPKSKYAGPIMEGKNVIKGYQCYR